MGGDEFTLVFPGLDSNAIQAKVAQMDQMASEAACEVNPEAKLTLSVGVAIFPEHGTDAEQLLAEADRRMYRNKQARKLAADNSRGFLFDRKTAVAN
jgi:diguanylate cyclase (GGDEF)-like protein